MSGWRDDVDMTNESTTHTAAVMLDDLLSTCWDAFWDYSEQFTCSEAETIAAIATARGFDGAGFLASHAEGDAEGDDHYQGGTDR